MPGLVLFRRRWSTGSDDLVLPGALLIFIHTILFIIIACIVTSNDEIDYWANMADSYLQNTQFADDTLTHVHCARQMRNFAFIYLLLLGFAIMIEVVMVGFSMQGSVLNTKPRSPVEYVLYLRIGIGIVEVVYTIISAVFVANYWQPCSNMDNVNSMFLAIVIIYSFVIIIVIIVAFCVFDPNGRAMYRIKYASRKRSMSISRIERMRKDLANNSRRTWLSRLGCCLGGYGCSSNSNQHQIALSEASALISDFFRDLDLVPSDIIAGLTLLRHKQQCIRNNKTITECWCRIKAGNVVEKVSNYFCGRPITSNTQFVDLSNLDERREFEDMLYYCSFALASYGPLFYIAEHPGTGCCKVFSECVNTCCYRCHIDTDCGHKSTCCNCECCWSSSMPFSRHGMPTIRSNKCCGWGFAGVKKSLADHGISEENVDIVFMSWENEIYKQPFFLCVDHGKKTIVVTVRGTIGESDALTDLITVSSEIPAAGNDGSWKGHKGMVESAQYIKRKLIQHEMVLSQGFGRDLSRGTRDYGLVLVGHSLGAGVVAILSLMLRDEYPTLKCYAYSPPGGLLSYDAMIESKKHVRSVVLGKDVVTRLGLPQMEKLRNEIIYLLKHTNKAKYKLIFGGCFKSSKHRHAMLQAETQSTNELKVVGDLQSTLGTSTQTDNILEDMFPPGRLLHVVYDRKSNKETNCIGSCSTDTKHYYIIESDNTSDFDEIMVSNQMISHHLPHNLYNGMKKALQTPNNLINKSYSEAKTLPSDTPLNQNHSNDVRQKPPNAITTQPHPDVVMETLRNVENNSAESLYPSSEEIMSHGDNDPLLEHGSESRLHELTPSTASPSSPPTIGSIELPGSNAPLARPDSFSETESACSPDSVKYTERVIAKPSNKITTIAEVNSPTPSERKNSNTNNNNGVAMTTITMEQPQASSTPIDPVKIQEVEEHNEDDVFPKESEKLIQSETPPKPTTLSLKSALLNHAKSSGDVTETRLSLPSTNRVERSASMVDNFREYLDHVLNDPRQSLIDDDQSDTDVKIRIDDCNDSIGRSTDDENHVQPILQPMNDQLRISLPSTPDEQWNFAGKEPKTPTSVKSCSVGTSGILPRARFEPNLIPKPPRSFSSLEKGSKPKNIKSRRKVRRHSTSAKASNMATM